MEFAQVYWLLLLPLPLVWAGLALVRGGRGEAGAWLLRHPHLVSAGATAPPGPRLPVALLALAWGLLILALAQPRQVGDWIQPPPEGRDIALVLDTSLTMSIDDFELAGRKTTRMAVLKEVLGKFVIARENDRIGLLVFGSSAATLTPPSFDHRHLNAQLQRLQVGMAGENTALGDAIGLALKQVRQGKLRPAIILVSDGEASNSGDMTPAEAVAVARQLGVAIHAVQIGSPLFGTAQAAVAEEEVQPGLADIARLSGGQHWQVRSTADAESVIRAIDALEKTLARPARHRQVHEWYLAPLLLAAAGLLLARALLIRRQGG